MTSQESGLDQPDLSRLSSSDSLFELPSLPQKKSSAQTITSPLLRQVFGRSNSGESDASSASVSLPTSPMTQRSNRINSASGNPGLLVLPCLTSDTTVFQTEIALPPVLEGPGSLRRSNTIETDSIERKTLAVCQATVTPTSRPDG